MTTPLRWVHRLFSTLTGQVVTTISALTVIIGSWMAFDGWVAKAADVKLVEFRLDRKILSDDRARTQQQIWNLEDRYGVGCAQAEKAVRDQCRDLREQLRQYDEKLQPSTLKK